MPVQRPRDISIFINERARARRERMRAYVDHAGVFACFQHMPRPFLSDPPFDFVLNGRFFVRRDSNGERN